MILNRDCFFYKKSDFINRQSELSPDSIVYIADTHQIYTHGAFFECALTTAKVKELIENYGYLTPADLPELTGGSAPLEGTYIDGVTVDGHNITIHRGNFSEINVGSATKLENPRDIILSGDISGQVSFDGTKDVTIETTVHNSETADRLTNPRTISLIGQSSGSAYFDGSRDISIETTTNNLNSVNANNKDLNSLVTLNGYLGNLFYGAGGNTSLNKPENVDSFGLFTFKSANGNYSTQILGSSLDRIYARSGADSSLGDWNTIAYLTDNVASATKLYNTRTFTISDGQHTGSSSNFDGTSNVVLDLPDIINADIIGNLTGDITGNVTGDLYGNADTATKLETGRNINGTLFDGTEDITTIRWGTARNIGIVNSDGSGTPIPVSVNGGSNVNLKLPATIKANITGDLNGNANTASKLQTPVDINLNGDATGSVSFDGSKDVTINVDVNTASKLENAFTLTLGGDTTGSVSIDGSKNVTLSVTVKDNSHNHTVGNITDLNSTWDQYLTGGGLYERNLVMNGTTYPVFTDVSGASTMTWYAPTTAGTSGYILQSTGGIPQWISISTLGSLLDGRYVNVSGDTMTGGLTLPGNQTYAFNSLGLMFSDDTGRIGTNNKGELGIYAKTDIYLRPDSSTNSSNTGLYISSDVITYNNYPLLHSNNYTDYVYSKSQSDSRYVKNGGDVDTAYIRYAGINGSNYNFLSNVNNQYPFMIYAPSSAGTSGYVLQSTGSIPQWTSRATLQHQLFSAGEGCEAIPGNADLNNYHTPGNYYCSYNATVATIANTPSDYAFNLTVLEAAGVIQIYREYGYSSSAREFTRRYYNETWTPWVQTPRMTDIYTQTELDNRYALRNGSNATGTWPISISGNATGLVNSDPDSFLNRLIYHIEVGGEVGSTEGGGVWGVPSDSQDARYGQGQYIRMGWPSGTYYTDIYTGPNNAGTARGLQWRQVVADNVVNANHREGWRLLLDTLNYPATLDSRYMQIGSAGYDTAYERNIVINGTTYSVFGISSDSMGSIYVPTTAGTSGQWLKSTGGVPKWVNDGSGSGLDADLLDGYHRSTLFQGTDVWLDVTSGLTKTITVGGSSSTYYPVVITCSTDKKLPTFISIWKNLGSATPDISGNHDNGTSSLWLIYEGRSTTWDGNGGFYRLKYKSQRYGTLVAHASYSTGNNGGLIVWLRGGGCEYNITCTNTFNATVYLSSANLGSNTYPENIDPKTAVDNGGVINGTFYGNASSATKLANSRMLWGQPFDGTGNVNGDMANVGSISMNGSISGATSITASANIKASDFTGAYISDNAVNYFVGNVEDGLGSGKSGLLLYAYGSKGIYLYTNSEQRMVVNASGNVGIGTTAPAYTLDVAGSIRATSGFTGNLTGNASSATKLQTARTISLTGDVTGSVSFDGTKDVSITATVANDSHTHSWENITGKPSTFTPSPHTHDYLSGWSDTRGTAETPNSYNEVFEAKGIKQSSTYGISSGNYVQVFGYRGWHDSSGGRAHEFALADNGRIYHRDGSTTSWDSWDTVAYLSDLDGYATEDWVNSQGFLKNDTNTTYTLSQSGNTIFLNGSDGSESSVSISQSVSTTYTLTKSGSNIILRGSDGSESSVVDSNTTYDLSAYATINWVSNNFDSVSISRDQTSGVRIAVINVSGTSYSLYAPTAGEVSLTWDSISGKPSCYTPCDHGHHFDDITFNNTGTNRQYLAGDGRFYTISYNEISGTPAQYSLPILSNSTLGGAKVNLKHTSSCTFESSHTSTSTSVSVNSRTTVSGRYYAVEADSNGYLFVNVPWEAGESGGGITSINDAAGSSTATGYLITDASGSTVYRRALKKEDITNVLGDDYDTKNTAGSTNSTSKLFLIGAPEQSANPVTYSESGCYISGGQLYSDSELVATQPWVQSWVEDNLSIDFSMSSTNATNLSLTINGTTKNITNLYADTVDGYDISVVSTTPSTMLVNTIYFVY